MERKKWNKKGWLKVLEAVIAITLIIGFLLYMIVNNSPGRDITGDINQREQYILNSVSKNDALRADILNGLNTNVNSYIAGMISPSWNFTTNICDLNQICNQGTRPNDRDIYVNEIVISSTNANYGPKKLRLFVWVK
jgi:hypothetical protein